MPNNKKKGAQSLQQQLENTRERMDEAQDRLEASNLPQEEQRAIKAKNKHRQEQIEGLESELNDGYNVTAKQDDNEPNPTNELYRH